jgi:hypothetical protein
MPLIERVLELAGRARTRAVVVSPFAKERTFARLIDALGQEVALTLFTRWRPEEVAQGISDLEVWDTANTRPNTKVMLCNNLHAKCYLFDDQALVGSANLTSRGLGTHEHSNLEFLTQTPAASPDLSELLTELDLLSVPATQEHRNRCQDASDVLIAKIPPNLPPPNTAWNATLCAVKWIPQTRYPEKVYEVYAGEHGQTAATLETAGLDLACISAPLGLSREEFRLYVYSVMMQYEFFQALYDLAGVIRRFGEYRDFVRNFLEDQALERDPTEVTQTAMRWLLHFGSSEFSLATPNYSELLVRKPLQAKQKLDPGSR